MTQPLGERSDITGQVRRPGFGPPREVHLDDKFAIRILLARVIDPDLQPLTPGHGALGKARQRVGETIALPLDVKHIAVARRITPGRLLPGAQALPGISDRMVRLQSPRGGVQQRHAPGVSVAMFRGREEIAVGRRGIDAGQHR